MLRFDRKMVKTPEKQYIEAQLACVGPPGPEMIGIDEVPIRKGHTYRIVIGILERKRPIWFGVENRSEASLTSAPTFGASSATAVPASRDSISL
ncbi:MAG: hypothetical protein U1E60_24605 [Reyranellaceae bacterium]